MSQISLAHQSKGRSRFLPKIGNSQGLRFTSLGRFYIQPSHFASDSMLAYDSRKPKATQRYVAIGKLSSCGTFIPLNPGLGSPSTQRLPYTTSGARLGINPLLMDCWHLGRTFAAFIFCPNFLAMANQVELPLCTGCYSL